MGPGIVLIILGAILTFAVRGDTNFVNLHVVGVIFLIAGSVLVYFGRNGGTRARRITTVEDLSDPDRPVQTVTEEVTEQDPYDRLHGELQGDLEPAPAPDLVHRSDGRLVDGRADAVGRRLVESPRGGQGRVSRGSSSS